MVTQLRINFVLGWVGIFILGYYLSYCNITKKAETVIYILGVLSLIFTIVVNGVMSVRNNQSYEPLYDLTNINILLTAMAVFVYTRLHVSKVEFSERSQKLILLLSECSFGVYFVHRLIVLLHLHKIDALHVQVITERARAVFVTQMADNPHSASTEPQAADVGPQAG